MAAPPPSYANATGQAPYPTAPYPTTGQPPYPSGQAPAGQQYPQYGAMLGQGDNVENPDSYGDGPTFRFNDKKIRSAFIRKVMFILCFQLTFTAAFCAIFYAADSLKYWVQRNTWCYYVSYGVFLVSYIAIVCCKSFSRSFPGNVIALAVLTLAISYMTATITSFYSIESIFIGFGITAVMCIAIAIFATQTKIDFTMCSGFLFVITMVFMLFGLVTMIWFIVDPGSAGARIVYLVYAALGALVFSLWLVYDIQVMVGGKKHELSPEEYVYASVQIYLDVIYIFWMVMALVGGGRGE